MDSVKKKGVYRSFTEFQQNNPSFTDSFHVVPPSLAARIFLRQARDRIKVKNEEGKLKKLNGLIWGYCDGKDAHIKRARYEKIHTYGYFCIYEGLVIRYSAGLPDGQGGYYGGGSYTELETFIMDYTNGVSRVLTKSALVTHVLSKDPYLLAAFKNEDKKRKQLNKYVLWFNERNTSKLSGGPYKGSGD